MRFIFLIVAAFIFSNCGGSSNNTPLNKPTATPAVSVPVSGYEIVKKYPHDERAFTQGLVVHNGAFFESTGKYGDSTVRKVEIETGKVLQKKNIPREFFAEGLTILGSRVFQVTWQESTAFEYDLNFKLIREIKYSGEGWGLTNDGTSLILSDGTHVIRFVDPETFQTTRTIVVNDERGRKIAKLNELEYVKGEIWANVWHSDEIGKPNHIARISPADGKLLGWINLDGISPDDVRRDTENTLNGIAYDAANDRIFVTGKNWRSVFEIKLR